MVGHRSQVGKFQVLPRKGHLRDVGESLAKAAVLVGVVYMLAARTWSSFFLLLLRVVTVEF